MKRCYLLAAAVVALSTTAAPALTVIEATGEDAAAIQSTVDAFRSALGDLNANEPVNNVGGRRQINWDAAPDAISDPNAFPGDFFNANVAPRARGIEFQATGDTTGFLLSSTEASGQPTAFGFPNDFPVFSEERLFSPVGGTTFDVLFFDPANPDQQATTTGLGVVFSGLDFDDTVSMSFFDIDGNLLAEEFASAPESAVGLSFLGVVFDSPVVASVSIAGGGRFLAGNGEFDGPEGDAFVMDDFIFGEPTPVSPVPLPAGAPMLVAALALAGMITRRRA